MTNPKSAEYQPIIALSASNLQIIAAPSPSPFPQCKSCEHEVRSWVTEVKNEH